MPGTQADKDKEPDKCKQGYLSQENGLGGQIRDAGSMHT